MDVNMDKSWEMYSSEAKKHQIRRLAATPDVMT